jgi:hypothetical protein
LAFDLGTVIAVIPQTAALNKEDEVPVFLSRKAVETPEK